MGICNETRFRHFSRYFTQSVGPNPTATETYSPEEEATKKGKGATDEEASKEAQQTKKMATATEEAEKETAGEKTEKCTPVAKHATRFNERKTKHIHDGPRVKISTSQIVQNFIPALNAYLVELLWIG